MYVTSTCRHGFTPSLVLQTQALSDVLQHFFKHMQMLQAPQHKANFDNKNCWKQSCADKPLKTEIFVKWITMQLNMIQQNLSHHFTQNQLYILMIPISHNVKIYPNWRKSPYCLVFHPQNCHFCNVLKILNNVYHQTAILSWTEQYKRCWCSMYSRWDILA